MPLEVVCDQCGTPCIVPDTFAGRRMPCPRCMTTVVVPGGAAEPEPPAAPAPGPAEAALPQSNLLTGLDEELPQVSAGASVLADPWAVRKTGRQWRRWRHWAPLGGAILGVTLIFFLLLVVTEPAAGRALGWVLALAGAAAVFASLGWLSFVAFCLPRAQRRTASPWSALAGSVAVFALAVGGIAGANHLIDRREHPEKYAVAEPIEPAAEPVEAASATGDPAKKTAEGKAKSATQAAGGTPAKPAEDDAPPPATDLISLENKGPAKPPPPGVPFLPPPDPAADVMETAFEEAAADYAARAMGVWLAGDAEVLKQRTRWCPAIPRATLGVRWAVGVQRPPGDAALSRELLKQIGTLTLALIPGLDERIDAGRFGDWPQEGDKRFRQAALLKEGRPEPLDRLLPSCRRRGVDLLLAVEPVPDPDPAKKGGGLRIRLFDTAEDRELTAFPQLPGQPPGKAGSSDNPQALAAEVFKYVDAQCVLQDFPWPAGDPAKRRADKLKAGPPRPGAALAYLVEVRYFLAREFLPAADAARLIDAVLGPGNGDVFVQADPAKRREMFDRWTRGE